ncbi:MAG: methyltransferase domain-containing protein [Leptospirales bacterium]|nr:methyltransferase domain-containing protein [Leptospirales bacterium]
MARAESSHRNLIQYYEEAGPDYSAWSPDFNMHFGFFRFGMNPFKLEPMLRRMNEEVLTRLQAGTKEQVLDMGCGLGATVRYIADKRSDLTLTGITLVPWQISQAGGLTPVALRKRVRFLQKDYAKSGFPAGSYGAAYALESSCYAEGFSKVDLLREAFRVLKPGARFVVADGFIKHLRPKNFIFERSLRKISDCWEVAQFGEIESFKQAAESVGFGIVKVEEISFHIAPSVAFVPWVTLRFFFKELLVKRSKLTRKRWDNAIAPFLGILVGLFRKNYGYYMITLEKPGKESRRPRAKPRA